jgi:hypothetical protein
MIYANNVKSSAGICGVYMVRCIFVLQPLVVTKDPLAAKESEVFAEIGKNQIEFIQAFYQGARAKLASNPDFFDASHILDGDGVEDFYDFGHTGPFTSPKIGTKIAEFALTRLK